MLYLCYTREDTLFATRLAEDLAGLGVGVWFDLHEIGPGVDWAAAQMAALAASEGLILVLSPEALAREHVAREVNRAFETDRPVYLAVARRSPWQEWLAGLPYADFTEDYATGLDALLLSITEGKALRRRRQVDPAEAFLRFAEGRADPAAGDAGRSAPEDDEGDPSWLARTLRRFLPK